LWKLGLRRSLGTKCTFNLADDGFFDAISEDVGEAINQLQTSLIDARYFIRQLAISSASGRLEFRFDIFHQVFKSVYFWPEFSIDCFVDFRKIHGLLKASKLRLHVLHLFGQFVPNAHHLGTLV